MQQWSFNIDTAKQPLRYINFVSTIFFEKENRKKDFFWIAVFPCKICAWFLWTIRRPWLAWLFNLFLSSYNFIVEETDFISRSVCRHEWKEFKRLFVEILLPSSFAQKSMQMNDEQINSEFEITFYLGRNTSCETEFQFVNLFKIYHFRLTKAYFPIVLCSDWEWNHSDFYVRTCYRNGQDSSYSTVFDALSTALWFFHFSKIFVFVRVSLIPLRFSYFFLEFSTLFI